MSTNFHAHVSSQLLFHQFRSNQPTAYEVSQANQPTNQPTLPSASPQLSLTFRFSFLYSSSLSEVSLPFPQPPASYLLHLTVSASSSFPAPYFHLH
mmetsp:Transcript_29615/g.47789  ORF Transcript_29615/g.47789 Transcript_29615/m.47789 type:complete len:96 (-) Transcript_29615:105-392(-)